MLKFSIGLVLLLTGGGGFLMMHEVPPPQTKIEQDIDSKGFMAAP